MPGKLKCALGMKVQPGAYGGGNQFGRTLTEYLQQRGVEVVTELKDPDIDVILITDTRAWLATCAFAGSDSAAYVRQRPQTKILFRVNECDQKRGTTLRVLNMLIARHAALADQVIYISSWLKNLFAERHPDQTRKSVVIHNGADQRIFNSDGYQPWDGRGPLRLVTHHWSSNRYKGLDVYHYLDQLLGSTFKDKLTFTFIGNPPPVALAHSTVLPPLSDSALAREIKNHHVYLTASLFEPAGMHHIEGALCGLPLLYRQSGALPEYCQGFGVPFQGPADVAGAVATMFKEYPALVPKMSEYTHTAEHMCEQYYRLILEVVKQPSVRRRSYPVGLELVSHTLFAKESALNLLRSYS